MKQKNCYGFCLLEWLVVILMLTAMSLMGISKWQIIKHKIELENETLSLFAFLQQVQSKAIWRNQTLVVRLIKDKKDWYFVTQKQGDLPEDFNVNAGHKITRALRVSIKFIHKNLFTFYGQHNTAEPGSINLQNQQGMTRIVISSKGRLRYCSEQGILSRIPVC